MGFFDRMGNLGKGVGKVWAKNAREAIERIGKEEWGDDAPLDPIDRQLRMLERLRDDGILNETEYRSKRAEVLSSRPVPDEPEVSRTAFEQAKRNAGDTAAKTETDDDEALDVTKKPLKRNL